MDVGKLKAVPANLRKLSDVVENEVANNTKFNILKTKVSKLDVTTLIHINQYNIDE